MQRMNATRNQNSGKNEATFMSLFDAFEHFSKDKSFPDPFYEGHLDFSEWRH